MENLFEYSGLANKEDLNSEFWSKTFQILEKYQESFVSLKPFPKKYPWPKDPLHSWSRAWEYPYVYYHLQHQRDKQLQTVLDIGSGVTFFPFAVKALGFGKVIALDTDQTYVKSFEELNKAKGVDGSVEFHLGSALKLPFSKNSIDLVYCISVLEHIPNSSLVLDEIYDVLKPEGKLVLTFDLDLIGGLELSPTEFYNLKSLISNRFKFSFAEHVIHPLSALTTQNSPFNAKRNEPNLFKALRKFKGKLSSKKDPYVDFNLSIYSCVLEKIG